MNVNKLFFAASAAAILTTGCYTKKEVVYEPAGASREVVVVDTPPAPEVETMGVAPSANHVWIPGHWTRQGDRWMWSSGHWDLRPTSSSVYVPGHWEKRGDGYLWREGYWK